MRLLTAVNSRPNPRKDMLFRRSKGANFPSSKKVIIFHSQDDYPTSFLIGYFTRRDIMMASKMNEVTLPTERGFHFQFETEDKWGYKWRTWMTEIELSGNGNYLGSG
ncbi:MAG: molybdopterin-dependent oxidoreductase [Deltaproteobacteria bacterium]|nr:molybdopterin-dependent oxidoreductase [Deltaproteobacteria bacterium]